MFAHLSREGDLTLAGESRDCHVILLSIGKENSTDPRRTGAGWPGALPLPPAAGTGDREEHGEGETGDQARRQVDEGEEEGQAVERRPEAIAAIDLGDGGGGGGAVEQGGVSRGMAPQDGLEGRAGDVGCS